MSYVDRDRQRQYQRDRRARLRAEWIAEHGPCVKCGSWDALEIDHIDPAQKSAHISGFWSRRPEVLYAELAKCQVLCKPCHLEKTYAGMAGHGTERRYHYGRCRCDVCRAGHAARSRAWRAKRRQRRTDGE